MFLKCLVMDNETNNFETRKPRFSNSNEGATQNYSQKTPNSASTGPISNPDLNSPRESSSDLNNRYLGSKGLDKTKKNTEKQRTPWPLNLNFFNLSSSATSRGLGLGTPREQNRQDIVSITYEEIGFFPRSFSRVFDRFLKQVFSDVDNLVIQEYRFYRYLFLTTLKCLLILFSVPFLVNYLSKTYLVSPLTEYFWNTQQTEIFLNSYQQKRAFTELKDFEEKFYFESLLNSGSKTNRLEHVSEMKKSKLGNSSLQHENLESMPEGQKRNKENFSHHEESTQSLSVKTQPESYQTNTTLNKNTNIYGINLSSQVYTKTTESLPEGQKLDLKMISTTGLVETLPVEPANIEIKTGKTSAVLSMPERYKQTIDIVQKSSRQENFEQRLQEKTIELAIRYNNQSIEAITNFFADLISFLTLCYLLVVLEIQVNITKSFLLEVFFGLDDGKKSLLILLITDLLVGYHSSNLWELFFEFLFNHYGLPESQTGIFLLVATLPVLLDVLFKYLIFRHLNRSSPATVATYHAIIE
jgi:hypothetical protein